MISSFNSNYIHLILILGFLSILLPVQKPFQQFPHTPSTHASRLAVLSLIWCLIGEILVEYAFSELTGLIPLSKFLSTFGNTVTYYLINSLARLTGFYFFENVLQILNFVAKNLNRRYMKVSLSYFLFSLVCAMFRLSGNCYFYYQYLKLFASQLGFLVSGKLVSGILILIDTVSFVGALHTFSFVTFVPFQLVGIYEDFCNRFILHFPNYFKITSKIDNENIMFILPHPIGNMKKLENEFLEEFSRIQDIFDKFNEVGGCYAGLIIVLACTDILTVLSDSFEITLPTLIAWNFGYAVMSIASIISISYIGTFISSHVIYWYYLNCFKALSNYI